MGPLSQIARILKDINVEDLTDAEKQIVDVLDEQGILEISEEEYGDMVRLTKIGKEDHSR